MNEFNYQDQVDQLFTKTENFLDKAIEEDKDIDYEKAGNLLTISFPNRTKIIMNTQAPLKQIWLATKAQGYHFDFKGTNWICDRTQQDFESLFKTAFEQQLNSN